jgi:endoglucanase
MKFTNLVLAASAASLAAAYPRARDVVPAKQSIKKRSSGFTWVGVSESGAEFGEGNVPGTLGSDYTWPETSQIKILRDAGMNIFRVPFLMERLIPSTMTSTPDSTYLAALKTVSYTRSTGPFSERDKGILTTMIYRLSSSSLTAVPMRSLTPTTTEDSELHRTSKML